MSKHALWLAAVVAVAGCGRAPEAPEVARDGAAVSAPRTPKLQGAAGSHMHAGVAPLPAGVASHRANADAGARFADLPDRGDLAGYPADPVVRREGTRIRHRADFSEAHARAAIGGVLRFTTPAGERLDFAYDRHVEHASGDWTWIGRLVDGNAMDEAILTFGREGVVGRLFQPGSAPLRLETDDGVGWVEDTVPQSVSASAPAPALETTPPDFALPPALDRAAAMASRRAVARRQAAQQGPPVVDLLIAYTRGYRDDVGGDGYVRTRLHFMVDLVNEAFANSGIEAEVRLVHAMLVDYPDTTDALEALDELTSGTCHEWWCGQHDRLDSVRQARDDYGADLVTLVRKHWISSNVCGIGWLLGYRGYPVSDYQAYGYNIVNEGSALWADGRRSTCHSDVLAHELGHNLGSAHDRVTSAGPDGSLDDEDFGAYPYAFGHKTGPSAGDFTTIMSYEDRRPAPPQQSLYWLYSNPLVPACNGFACGVADEADNARAFAQTIPAVAAFRAARVGGGYARTPGAKPVVAMDLDGNERSELAFFHQATNRWGRIWGGEGRDWYTYHREAGFIDGSLRLVDAGDMDGDGRDEMLLSGFGGQLWVGSQVDGVLTVEPVPAQHALWQEPLALADANGDHRSDIIIRDSRSGRVSIWYMEGALRKAFNSVQMPPGLRFVGHGDFNRDRFDDLLWVEPEGGIVMSLGVGLGFDTASTSLSVPEGHEVVGVHDINGNKRSDILLQRVATGRLSVWFMSGRERVAARSYDPPAGARLIGKGDFDGDGRGDLAWLYPAEQVLLPWYSLGVTFDIRYGVLDYSGWSPMNLE